MNLKEIALDVVKLGRTHDEEATRFLKSNEQRLNENFRRLKEATESIMADFTDVYRKSEVDALLAGKANVSHNHDSRYYTETEINSLVANGLLYKGYAKTTSTDFNNITESGIYYLDNTTMTNAPSAYQWAYLLVMTNPGTVQKTQIVVSTNSNIQNISSRTYSGNPAAWGSWRTPLENSYGNLMNTGYRPYTDGSAVSVPTATWKSVCSLTLAAGRWIVYATGRFNTNANGTHRSIRVSTSADSSSGTTVQFTDYRAPTSGTYTYCKSMDVAVISAQTTYYLNAYQDSGSSLDVTGRLYAIRIS